MPGQYSSQATVIDAIVAMARALPVVQGVGNTPSVPVIDGPPGGAGIPPTFISFLGQGDTDASETTEEWAWIGSRGRYENYGVRGAVYCFVGGDDNLGQSGFSDAQQQARAKANVLLQAVEAGLLADPSLSEQNGGDQLVVWAYLTSSRLRQTGPDDPDITKGRWAQFDFTISVKNTLSLP